MEAVELDDSREGALRLDRFYRELYELEFPDRNERESLRNMRRYLALKHQAWYGRNSYHILVLSEHGRPVAGAVLDYLSRPNAGVIEFLVVQPAARGTGVGRLLHDWVEETLRADARRSGKPDLAWIIGEMNDPFHTPAARDNLDPFLRAWIWHRWGYRRLRFPYVQPALAPGKQAVTNLLLMARCLDPGLAEGVPSPRVSLVLREYMRWAMRIDRPARHPDYQRMARWLAQRPTVPTEALATYIGQPQDRALAVHEVRTVDDPDMAAAVAVYWDHFAGHATAVDPAAFRPSRQVQDDRGQPIQYHLWALRRADDAPVEGLASFFTFRRAGFIGYIVYRGQLRGTGRFPVFLARAERQMLADSPTVQGVFAECDLEDGSAPLFERLGYRVLDLVYRQPPLPGSPAWDISGAPELLLLYKDMGEQYATPSLTRSGLLRFLGGLHRTVYGLSAGAARPYREDVLRQLGAGPGDRVRWRSGRPP